MFTVPVDGFNNVNDLLMHFFATFKRRSFTTKEVFQFVVVHFPPGQAQDTRNLGGKLHTMASRGKITKVKPGVFKYKAAK